MPVQTIKRVLPATLMQLGVFAFVETLLFRPFSFAPSFWEQPTSSSPLFLILAVIASMLAWAGLFYLASRFFTRAIRTIIGISVFALPLLASGMLLASALIDTTTDEPQVMLSTLVAVMLGVASIAQFTEFTYELPMNSSDLLLSIGGSMLIAALLSFLALLLSNDYFICLLLLCAVMLVSGGYSLARMKRARETTLIDVAPSSLDADVGDSNESLSSSNLPAVMIPIILVSLVCAAFLGLDWIDHSSDSTRIRPALMLVALVAAACFIVLLRWYWRKVASVDALLIAMAAPLLIPLLVAVFGSVEGVTALLTIGLVSNLLLFCLGWIASLLLAGYDARFESVRPAFICAFLTAYGISAALSTILRSHMRVQMLAVVAICWMLYLIFYLARKNRSTGSGAQPADGTLSKALRQKCERLAEDRQLSARETELLPLLSIGLSGTAIGNRLCISPKTVKTHRYNIYAKLGIHSHEELLALIEPDI